MSTIRQEQQRKADEFLALHHASRILVLPNAWDVASEKIYELEGFKAIGTTSAGISASLGYADGEKMSLAENLGAVRRIVDHTILPVSADIEAGYAGSAEGVAETARAVINVGAVGLNIEDSTGNPSSPILDMALQQERIRAIRKMSDGMNVHLVINARTDVCMLSEESTKGLRQAIDRGNAYREAGADCIFVPDVGTLDKNDIALLVNEIDAPLNIVAGATTPPIAELQDIGVARVSLGPRPMRALLSLLRRIARELRTTGTYKLMSESTISYSEVNRWFADSHIGNPDSADRFVG